MNPGETPFEAELRALLNRHSIENSSHTPDFILVRYVIACLDIFARTTFDRDQWWGFTPWGGPHPATHTRLEGEAP